MIATSHGAPWGGRRLRAARCARSRRRAYRARCDALRGVAVAVELRAVGGHRARPRRRCGDRAGSSSTSTFAPASTVSTHSVEGRERHARHAVPVRLLLQAAGVGEDHARLRGERGEVEVAERLDGRSTCRRARARARRAPSRVRGCAGKTTGSSSRASPSTIRRRRVGRDVRLAVDRRDDVAAGLDAEPSSRRDRSRAIGAKRSVASAITSPTTSVRAARRPRLRACPRERSSGQRSSAAIRSTSMRLRSSGIARSPLRSPASTCATGTPASAAARAPASVELVSP